MELQLKIKTEIKTKDNSKSFFSKVFPLIIVIFILIIYFINSKYNFYIGITGEKEKIEVNAIYSNPIKNDDDDM